MAFVLLCFYQVSKKFKSIRICNVSDYLRNGHSHTRLVKPVMTVVEME